MPRAEKSAIAIGTKAQEVFIQEYAVDIAEALADSMLKVLRDGPSARMKKGKNHGA